MPYYATILPEYVIRFAIVKNFDKNSFFLPLYNNIMEGIQKQ